MKLKFILILLVLCQVGIADEILWQQDFEDQVPGEHPTGWHERTQPADALAVITNTATGPGRKQLLLDRASGKNTGKANALIKRITIEPLSADSPLFCSFIVKLQGNGAKGSFEIRDRSLKKRLACVAFGNKFGPNIAIYTGRWQHQASAGRYELDTWYRVTCQLPLDNKSDKMTCSVDVLKQNTWQQQKTVTLPFNIKNFNALGFYLGMPRQGSKLFIDSITISKQKDKS